MRNSPPIAALGIVSVLVVLFVGPARAAILVVDDSGGTPYSTIQSAIIAATPGVDDVFVNCGVYNENIVMVDGVSVSGAGPQCAIIDGTASGSVVTAVDIGSTTVLEGFTIRNGSAAQGGGLFMETSELVVRNNVIAGNAAVGGTNPDGVGGGIHIQTDFSFSEFQAATSPLISNNVIRDNTADRLGGGINIDGGEGTIIVNNLIVNNTAVLIGGALHAFNSFPDLVNNTIVRNCMQGAGTACSGGGGGVALTSSGIVDIVNNVIAWNEAASGGGGVDMAGSTASFLNNDAFGNTPVNYLGVTDPTGGSGNISADPLFVEEVRSAAGHHPRSDSPLVEGGTSTLAPAADIRGIPRPMDGDADATATEDIGARENEGITRLEFLDRQNVTWDDSVDPSALFNLYRGDYQALLSSCTTSCVYIQDTATVADARQWCNLVTPAAVDTDPQGAGDLWFYLAVVNATNEGTLGFDGTPTERPFTVPNSCP